MSMINVSKQFDDPTLNMLRACRAHTLLSYEAYTPFGTDHVYKLARLHFDGIDLDLTNAHEELVLGPDYAEEQFAVMGLDHADVVYDQPVYVLFFPCEGYQLYASKERLMNALGAVESYNKIDEVANID